jgi:hypothetical protein
MAKTSCLSRLRTAEPVVFLYAFGLLIHSPLIQQYIYDRVSEDKGYNNTLNSRTECANDTELHDEVCNFMIFLVNLLSVCAVLSYGSIYVLCSVLQCKLAVSGSEQTAYFINYE